MPPEETLDFFKYLEFSSLFALVLIFIKAILVIHDRCQVAQDKLRESFENALAKQQEHFTNALTNNAERIRELTSALERLSDRLGK